MDGLRSIRPLGAESLRGITPAVLGKRLPKFEWVDPTTLFVEEAYQRAFSENSIRLIRNIVANWNWALFKVPICVRLPESGSVLVVVDGQHTATAAATHPEIEKIPVMVVGGDDVANRAQSFVGHNTNRIALTQQAIFTAEVAAGNPTALIMKRACDRAGVIIPRTSQNSREYKPGMTVAIGTIRSLARGVGEEVLTRALTIAVKTKRAPIRADELGAIGLLLTANPKIKDADIVKTVSSKESFEWAAQAKSNAGEGLDTAAMGTLLASAWATVMGLSLDGKIIYRPRGIRSVGDTVIKPVRPEPIPKPIPTPAPAPVAAPTPPVVPMPADNRYVRRNGVVIDLVARSVEHRGETVMLTSPDHAIWLVAALTRVMPALLDNAMLEQRVFGKKSADLVARLRPVVNEVNPIIKKISLEIKTVPKMGFTLQAVEVEN